MAVPNDYIMCIELNPFTLLLLITDILISWIISVFLNAIPKMKFLLNVKTMEESVMFNEQFSQVILTNALKMTTTSSLIIWQTLKDVIFPVSSFYSAQSARFKIEDGIVCEIIIWLSFILLESNYKAMVFQLSQFG